jgi:hypothetical protein
VFFICDYYATYIYKYAFNGLGAIRDIQGHVHGREHARTASRSGRGWQGGDPPRWGCVRRRPSGCGVQGRAPDLQVAQDPPASEKVPSRPPRRHQRVGNRPGPGHAQRRNATCANPGTGSSSHCGTCGTCGTVAGGCGERLVPYGSWRQ